MSLDFYQEAGGGPFFFDWKVFLLEPLYQDKLATDKKPTVGYSIPDEIPTHWRIQGVRRRRAPPSPTGSISFIFAYVFAEKCTHRRSAPPPTGQRPPQREILDPPLLPLAFSSVNWCKIYVFTSNIMVLHHKVS